MNGKPQLRNVIALILIVLGIARIAGAHNVDLTTLAYLALAIGLFYIDEFQEFSFGEKGFSFKRRAEKVASELGVGGKPQIPQQLRRAPETEVLAPDDPNKGRFGGQSVSNGKRLSAEVTRYPGQSAMVLY
jgi:hypothetical protein